MNHFQIKDCNNPSDQIIDQLFYRSAQVQATMTKLLQQQQMMMAQGQQQLRLRAPPPLKNITGA